MALRLSSVALVFLILRYFTVSLLLVILYLTSEKCSEGSRSSTVYMSHVSRECTSYCELQPSTVMSHDSSSFLNVNKASDYVRSNNAKFNSPYSRPFDRASFTNDTETD